MKFTSFFCNGAIPAVRLLILAVILFLPCVHLDAQNGGATFSIIAWDPETGDLGIAVESRMLAVGSVVPYAKAGLGVVAAQGTPDASFGLRAMDLLLGVRNAQEVVEEIIRYDSLPQRRQLALVDSRGNAYAFTGTMCQPWSGHLIGRGYAVQGHGIAGEHILKAMSRTFEITGGDLAVRLLKALDAAGITGAMARGRSSAALLVVRDKGGYMGTSDRFVDLRIDDDTSAVLALRRLYDRWEQTYLADARMRTIDEFNRRKNYSGAQEEIRRVVAALNTEIRNKPDDPEVLNRVAWTLATNEIDRDRALEYAKRAAKLSPGNLRYLSTLAECHYRLGHFDEAIAIGSELVAKDPANDDFWKQLQKFREAKANAGR